MDRAEAIKKVIEPDAGYDYQHALVDSLAALGLLKLDEPKPSPDARFSYAVARWVEAGSHAGELPVYVSAAGLKIVGKDDICWVHDGKA